MRSLFSFEETVINSCFFTTITSISVYPTFCFIDISLGLIFDKRITMVHNQSSFTTSSPSQKVIIMNLDSALFSLNMETNGDPSII